ncbi:MAG: ATP-binding protein [Planctomycetes bacterium]|nr:ATP-binding protein [Planctomycetota bacterium]
MAFCGSLHVLEIRVAISHISRYRFIVIPRPQHLSEVRKLLKTYPVVGVIGPRQIGKTTLAKQIAEQQKGITTHFDLEDARDLARLSDPALTLEPLRGLVVLDEIQRRPELFPFLRVLADRRPIRARFLVLGSASPEMLRQSSESLAGRISYYELPGLSLPEVQTKHQTRLWLRGGFPSSYTAHTNLVSDLWRRDFIQAFLERDLPQLGVRTPSAVLSRFWSMLAHYHGQIWNASEFARSFGVTNKTVNHYLDVLTSAFVVKPLQPWHENLKKRQVKAPKVYFADTGLLHSLLRLTTLADLDSHPKIGASWEGFVIHQIVQHLGVAPNERFFWATHGGAELDLLVVRGRKRWGFEVKRTSSPSITPSMRTAMTDLKLQRLFVVYAGPHSFDMARSAT